MKIIIDSMKTSQKTEFDSKSSSTSLTPIPTVYIRSQRPKSKSCNSDGTYSTSDSTICTNNLAVDPKEYMDEVDLPKALGNYSKNSNFMTLLNSDKWSNQVQALTMVTDAIGTVPKLKSETDLSPIISFCKATLRNSVAHVQLQLRYVLACYIM
jgi:hypothetical protein